MTAVVLIKILFDYIELNIGVYLASKCLQFLQEKEFRLSALCINTPSLQVEQRSESPFNYKTDGSYTCEVFSHIYNCSWAVSLGPFGFAFHYCLFYKTRVIASNTLHCQ